MELSANEQNQKVLTFNDFFSDPLIEELWLHKQSSQLSEHNVYDLELSLEAVEDRPTVELLAIEDQLLGVASGALDLEADRHVKEQRTQKPKPPQRKRIRRSKRAAPKDRYYDKNVCRNILRRAIRCLDSKMYEAEAELFCRHGCSVEEFEQELVNSMEVLTGPSALRGFLDSRSAIAGPVRSYLLWFLKERYIREALSEGHMKDIKRYIEYKNKVLIPLLQE